MSQRKRRLLMLYVAAVNTRHRKDARRIFDQLWKEA
jgi:hypothetical protein